MECRRSRKVPNDKCTSANSRAGYLRSTFAGVQLELFLRSGQDGERVHHWPFDPQTEGPHAVDLGWTYLRVRGSEAPRPFQATRLQTSTVSTALIRSTRNGTNPSWVAIRFTAAWEYEW